MRKYLTLIIFIFYLIFAGNCLFAADQTLDVKKCFPCAGLTAANIGSEKALDNPYEILNKYYEAIGGLDKVKAEKNSYCEGTIELAGLKGTYKLWREGSICERKEIDLGIYKYIYGENIQFGWKMDTNGKLQIKKDEAALKERRVDELFRSYEHLNPQSKYFKVTFEGVQKVGEANCYVIKIINSINEDIRLEYINTSNFYLEKRIIKSIDYETHTLFSDYRLVNGIKHPFKQEIETLPIMRTQVIQIVKYKSNLKINASVFEPPKEVADFKFDNGKNSENIPILYVKDHILVKVNINGKEGLWFLDSGAGISIIDSDYAKTIGLESKGDMKAYAPGKNAKISFVAIPSYSIQGIKFKEQKVASLEGLSKLIKMGMDLDIVGALGYDFLSRFVTKLDIANRKVSFYMPDKFKYEGSGKVIDAPIKYNMFFLPMTVDGRYLGNWMLDLGASVTSINYPFAEKNGLLKLKGINILAAGAGGFFSEKLVKFKTLEVGGFTIKDPLIAITLEKSGNTGFKEHVGTIGNYIVRHFVAYLDYNKQRVILEKGKDFDKIFPVDKSGLALILLDNGNIEVFYVSSDTPADEAGFKKGDIIKSINDKDIKSFGGLLPVTELLKEKSGTEYKFTILRDGETKQINLKLRDLF